MSFKVGCLNTALGWGLLTALLSGCASGLGPYASEEEIRNSFKVMQYQPSNKWERIPGFRSEKMDNNRIKLSVSGYRHTSSDLLSYIAYARAAELTLQEKKEFFKAWIYEQKISCVTRGVEVHNSTPYVVLIFEPMNKSGDEFTYEANSMFEKEKNNIDDYKTTKDKDFDNYVKNFRKCGSHVFDPR